MTRGEGERTSWPRFVRRVFQNLGADVADRPDGLRVRLTAEQRRRLEGRPRSLLGWEWSWGAPGSDEDTILELSFDVDEPRGERAGEDDVLPGEMCRPESFRGRQIIDAAMRLWPLDRRLPAAPAVPLRTVLVFHFHLLYFADDARRRRRSVAVDVSSGAAAVLDDDVPPEGLFAGREVGSPGAALSVGEAYEQARAAVESRLVEEGDAWARKWRARLADEEERLRAYVRRAALEENSDVLADVGRARLDELRQRRPRVKVELVAADVVYEPVAP